MTLAANALVTLAELQDYTGLSTVPSDAFDIYNTSGSNTTATVAVNDTTLTTVGSGTGTDTFTLANASYDTLAELTAAITALSEGWQIQLLAAGTVSSDLLLLFPATNAYGQSNSQRLQYNNTSLLEDLINRASDAIEQYCRTIFVAQTGLRQYFDGARDTIILNYWPVTQVTRVMHGLDTAFTLYATDTTDLRATVEVQDDQIVLTRVNSAGATVTVTRLWSASATVSALVTYINTQTGWSATLVNDSPTVDLPRMGSRDALNDICYVNYFANIAPVSHVNEEAGLVHLEGAVCERGQVLLNAGVSSVPDDVKQACILLVQEFYNARGQDSDMQSESIGSYSYTRGSGNDMEAGFSPTIKNLLAPHRRTIVG